MKKALCLILAVAISLACLSACAPKEGEGDLQNKEYILPEGYSLVNVTMPTENAVDGIGVEFDPHFLSQNLSKGAAKEDWEIVRRRVKELKIQKFRVQVLPEWYEPINDNTDANTVDWSKITKNTEEMKSLYAVLDLAKEVDANVNITLWGVSKTLKLIPGTLNGETPNPYAESVNGLKHFLGEGNSSQKSWIMGVAEVMELEWVENFSILMQLLINEKGYDCIKEITPTNEPSWAYYVQDASSPKDEADWDRYVSMCKKLHAKFKADQLRDKVLFNLSDDAESYSFLNKCVTELGDIADLYNSHTYKFTHDTKNSDMTEWETKNSNETAKKAAPHFIGEFGSNQHRNTSTKQYDINTYERGVFLVRQMLNFFNSGAVGMSYWVVFDQYYNRQASYNEFMQLGLWTAKKSFYQNNDPDLLPPTEDYQIRNQYYAYGLMTNYVERGSLIYPLTTTNELVAGTAFKNKDGKWVYVFANNSDAAFKYAVKNKEYGKFKVYEYLKDQLPTSEKMIESKKTAAFKNQCLTVDVQPNSIIMLVAE